MRIIEGNPLPGDAYIIDRDDDLSGLPEDLARHVEASFVRSNFPKGVFYREEYPVKGPMFNSSPCFDQSDEELVEMLIEGREFFLEERNA